MNKCKIYVEGIADQKFIADFISYHYNVSLIKGRNKTGIRQNDNLIEIGGINNKDKIASAFFERNSKQEINNIIIFDADENISKRKEELQYLKNKHNVYFDFFLFPNDKDKGELEDLLFNIINKKNNTNNEILKCWDEYEICINNIPDTLTLPAKKTKIYAYLEPLHGKSKSQKDMIKEANRDYKNEKHWDLDATYLKPLKDFLDKYFKKAGS